MSQHRATSFVMAVILGAVCLWVTACGSTSECTSNADCAEGRICASSGGVLFDETRCVPVETSSNDAASDVSDAGADADLDVESDASVPSLPMSPSRVELVPLEAEKVTAALQADASAMCQDVSWSASDNTVQLLENSGSNNSVVVVGKRRGSATITARCTESGATGEMDVSVSSLPGPLDLGKSPSPKLWLHPFSLDFTPSDDDKLLTRWLSVARGSREFVPFEVSENVENRVTVRKVNEIHAHVAAFDGNADALRLDGSREIAGEELTMFFVLRSLEASGMGQILASCQLSTANNQLRAVYSSGGDTRLELIGNTGLQNPHTFTMPVEFRITDEWVYFAVVLDADTARMIALEGLEFTAEPANQNVDFRFNQIGMRCTEANGNEFAGELAEVIAFEEVLSDSDIATVLEYLKVRYDPITL